MLNKIIARLADGIMPLPEQSQWMVDEIHKLWADRDVMRTVQKCVDHECTAWQRLDAAYQDLRGILGEVEDQLRRTDTCDAECRQFIKEALDK